MIQQKRVDEISLNFPELIIKGKDVNIRFKNRGSSCYFLSSRSRKIKILQKLNKRDCFCLHSWFHFYGVSRAKTDLHGKYDLTLCLAHFFNKIIH